MIRSIYTNIFTKAMAYIMKTKYGIEYKICVGGDRYQRVEYCGNLSHFFVQNVWSPLMFLIAMLNE